jgi:multicomponent Na+:H+ antiporter subunit G
MIDMVVQIMLYVAGAFSIIGAAGMIRFPDFYTRSHASTVVNVGGVTLALVALMTSQAFQLSVYSWKILLLIVLLALVNPTNSHALAYAAYKTGVKAKGVKK